MKMSEKVAELAKTIGTYVGSNDDWDTQHIQGLIANWVLDNIPVVPQEADSSDYNRCQECGGIDQCECWRSQC